MSSILTNNGAMVALQALKSINANLQKTQNIISTGKDIASAKDNAAIWAISKVMEADVKGFKGIADSLGLGESTVAVARQASETVTDLLIQMKEKIVASQEENVDRAKIQTDIQELQNQIGSVVSAAQFNGLNLLDTNNLKTGFGTVDILSSLDRSTSGVAASSISVTKQDLRVEEAAVTGTAVTTAQTATAINSGMTGTALAATALTGAATAPTTTLTIAQVETGHGYSLAITGAAGELVSADNPFNTSSANDIVYVAKEGDTVTDVAAGLVAAFNEWAADFRGENPDATGVSTIGAANVAGVITFTGANETGTNFSVQASGYAAKTAGGDQANTMGGGLADLADMDVTSEYGAEKALGQIEDMLQVSIDAAAVFGSAQKRIETQSDFVGVLMDSLKSGIGTLVDANMEEASARLQALQVQQQLGVQSLSIANQAPQSILSLFR